MCNYVEGCLNISEGFSCRVRYCPCVPIDHDLKTAKPGVKIDSQRILVGILREHQKSRNTLSNNPGVCHCSRSAANCCAYWCNLRYLASSLPFSSILVRTKAPNNGNKIGKSNRYVSVRYGDRSRANKATTAVNIVVDFFPKVATA